ncbi:MAG: SDR family oxidoreductase [Candidatus Algichlamydia australiensis]|nr:SDR family oxidoreductase [Chlamydiales bacterium]
MAEAKALSVGLGSRGISVNTVSLGGVWTEKLAEKMEKESQDSGESVEKLRVNRVQNIPLKKYAELSEVASVVEQMLGDLTSHLTRQNLDSVVKSIQPSYFSCLGSIFVLK